MAREVLLAADDATAELIPLGPLQAMGHTIRMVDEADVALDAARVCPPTVVLIGPSLREGCPAQLCRELKLCPDTNHLPVIRVLSPGHEVVSLEVEPDATVERSWSAGEVAIAISRALSSRAEALCEGALSDVRWSLPSDPDALEAFQEQFAVWLGVSGLSGFQMQRVGMAVRELAANAIEWGHAYQRNRLVSVAARLDDEKVSVLVRDSGPGFNPRDLPHAARRGDPVTHLQVRAEKQLREGGYGILMASGLVDHLAYNEAGNEALAIKYLRQRREALAS